jgi:hypothetical protein
LKLIQSMFLKLTARKIRESQSEQLNNSKL